MNHVHIYFKNAEMNNLIFLYCFFFHVYSRFLP